jgi:pimeloyl-ACP methyl ester carboxylesterase
MTQPRSPFGAAVRRRAVPLGAVLAVALGALVAGVPTAMAGARHSERTIGWHACPAYSDDALRARGLSDEQLPKFRDLLARTECGTVTVPLDYQRPKGRRITVAFTRLKAVDQSRRLGSVAVNPGGPGGSGYLMPLDALVTNAESAALNQRYDLIGFDPRGVGYSSKVNCPEPETGVKKPPGPLTEDVARQMHERQVRDNQACGRFDPSFLGEITTENVARDLDQVRMALHERKLNFLGVSWGTWLGAVYRTIFPNSVGRMFLDSVAIPVFRMDAFEDGRAAAAERNFSRLAAWVAQHHDTYGFGTSREQVESAVLAMRRSYDANPVRFTDLPIAADGWMIAVLASQDSPIWPTVTQALKELRNHTDTAAPPTVKAIFGGGPAQASSAEAPEEFNPTMHHAAFCNEDPSRLDFSAAWAAYQRRLDRNPVTGPASKFSAGCAGWPLPVQRVRVHDTHGSVVLSGHRYESISPYEWTTQMQSTIGGTVFTVNDDIHGSVLFEPDCAAKMVSYFDTGRIDSGCEGTPAPPSPTNHTNPDPRRSLTIDQRHP